MTRRAREQDGLRSAIASSREQLDAMAAVASSITLSKQANEVLVEVRAVPTIFPQLDAMLRVGGWPIERVALVHGPSNEGKTALMHGLGLSFLQAGHFYNYVDAEFTTPSSWTQGLMADFAKHPGFLALRPRNYEHAVDGVREFCTKIGDAKSKGQLAPTTSGLVVIDSLRKLVPKNFLAKIAKGSEESDDDDDKGDRRRKPKRGVDGAGGRGAMIKAAMNAAWLDELVPLLAETGTAIVFIARESENVDAGMFGEDFHVQGGKAAYYDSSVALRVMRDTWLRETSDAKSRIVGERHVIELRKTKVEERGARVYVRPRCFFHTSNGVLSPAGFDRAQDALDLALGNGVVDCGKRTIFFGETKLGVGVHAACATLRADPQLLNAVCKAAIAAEQSRKDVEQ